MLQAITITSAFHHVSVIDRYYDLYTAAAISHCFMYIYAPFFDLASCSSLTLRPRVTHICFDTDYACVCRFCLPLAIPYRPFMPIFSFDVLCCEEPLKCHMS